MNLAQGKRRWALAMLLVPAASLVLFLILVSLSARSISHRAGEGGNISWTHVALKKNGSQLFLDARADIQLPDTIKAGLNSGVPLDFILTMELKQPRRFWLDRSLARFQHRFRLSYYELTRHYRVHAFVSDTSRNFRSLSSALDGLGRFDSLALQTSGTSVFVVDDKLAVDNVKTVLLASLEFKLDARSLPLPLQPLILSSWRLASEEYLWPVN